MAIPDFQSIMLPFLKYLADKKAKTNQEITDALAKTFNLTQEEINQRLPCDLKRIDSDYFIED
jgi:restriction system protein